MVTGTWNVPELKNIDCLLEHWLHYDHTQKWKVLEIIETIKRNNNMFLLLHALKMFENNKNAFYDTCMAQNMIFHRILNSRNSGSRQTFFLSCFHLYIFALNEDKQIWNIWLCFIHIHKRWHRNIHRWNLHIEVGHWEFDAHRWRRVVASKWKGI